jgi:putative transcriptional regulator
MGLLGRGAARQQGHGLSDSGPIQPRSDRPIEALLAAHAAGRLSEPFAALVASHLQMRDANWASAAPTAGPGPRQPGSEDPMTVPMPLALRSYVSRHIGAFEWHTLLPGIKQCPIARSVRGGDTRLLRCRPGAAIPSHTHDGLEAVLVLQGGFHDATRHYAVGDIAVADSTVDHRPVADPGGECVVFVVLEAPVKLTGWFGRAMQRIFGA